MKLYDATGEEITEVDYGGAASSELKGKQVIWLGDSVIDYETPDGINLADLFASNTGAICHNWAQGGTCFAKGKASNYDPYSFVGMVDALVTGTFTEQETYAEDRSFTAQVNDMKTFDMSLADYCVIAFGTNDFWGNMTWINAEDEFDVNTSYGAINYGLKTLMRAYPELKILMIGLQALGQSYIETAAWAKETGDHYNYGERYNGFITELSNKYAIPLLKIQDCSMFNEYTNSTFTSGVPHLSHKGKQRYAKLIENALKLYY